MARELRTRWKSMFAVWFCCVVAFTGTAFLLAPKYRAETLLAPMGSEAAGLGQLLNQFGSIADLTGLAGAGRGDSTSALAVLKSRELGEEFIRDRGLVAEFAGASTEAPWARSPDNSPERQMWRAYKIFDRNVRTITDDRRTGLVTVRFEWGKAQPLADWISSYVALCNRKLQARAIDDATRQLGYLREQLDKSTATMEVRQALNRLIEARLKEMAVASTRVDFAFRTIDPAVIPLERSFPRRSAFLAVGILFGGLLCVCIALIRIGRRSGASGLQ